MLINLTDVSVMDTAELLKFLKRLDLTGVGPLPAALPKLIDAAEFSFLCAVEEVIEARKFSTSSTPAIDVAA